MAARAQEANIEYDEFCRKELRGPAISEGSVIPRLQKYFKNSTTMKKTLIFVFQATCGYFVVRMMMTDVEIAAISMWIAVKIFPFQNTTLRKQPRRAKSSKS